MSPRADRKKKKRDGFYIFYLIYILLIIAALFVVHNKVKDLLVSYEELVPENYIMDMIKGAAPGDGALGDYMEAEVFSQPYGNGEARKQRFYETVKSSEISFEAEPGTSTTSHPVYLVTADSKPFLRLALSEGEKHTMLGILTVCDWNVESCLLRAEGASEPVIKTEDGNTLSFTASLPEGFSLLVDGKPVSVPEDAAETDLDQFRYVKDYVDVPKAQTFTVSGLRFEPVITAQNNAGEPLEPERDASGVYVVPDVFVATDEARELALSVADPIGMAQLWSKYMTNDVGGAYHGRNTVREKCMLLPGSNLYELATNWASSVDITFVSHHSITGWTNETADNFIKYNDDFFSCDVYLEKNMHLTTGADRTDVFDNRMFFVNITDPAIAEPGWYLADMFSLAGN